MFSRVAWQKSLSELPPIQTPKMVSGAAWENILSQLPTKWRPGLLNSFYDVPPIERSNFRSTSAFLARFGCPPNVEGSAYELCQEVVDIAKYLNVDADRLVVGFAFVRQPWFSGLRTACIWQEGSAHGIFTLDFNVRITDGYGYAFRRPERCPQARLEIPFWKVKAVVDQRLNLVVTFDPDTDMYMIDGTWTEKARAARLRWYKLRLYMLRQSAWSAGVKAGVDQWLLKNGLCDMMDAKRRKTHHL